MATKTNELYVALLESSRHDLIGMLNLIERGELTRCVRIRPNETPTWVLAGIVDILNEYGVAIEWI